MTKSISFYPKPWEVQSQETIPIDIFFDNIRNGVWQDIAFAIRALPYGSEAQDKLKKKAPSVTMSGVFNTREDDKIADHSGYVAIDIDKDGFPSGMDAEMCKSFVCPDKYIVAAFTSIRGYGLCLIFRINPEKHREAFYGISEYLYSQYKIVVDPTSVNPSRARFVSFDPYIYVADHAAEKFTQYPKAKEPKKIDKVIYTSDDFSNILNQIVSNQTNITQNSYHVWLRLGFSIVSKFGEGGRSYFHLISQYSAKYDYDVCDKQYSACVRHVPSAGKRPVNISTFYYYAKESGVDIYSERTKKIAYCASSGKKSGLNADQIAVNLEKFEGIVGADVADIIKQVHENNIELTEDGLLDMLELWMRQSYQFRRNEITRYIESDNKPLHQKDLNSIFIKSKKIFDNLSYELLDRLINSDFVPSFNPLLEFFQKHYAGSDAAASTTLDTPNIDKLFNSIDSKDPAYTLYFGRKWLVSAVASAHGEISELLFALLGEVHGKGKTQFFRRLIPAELKPYYAQSKLDAGKDDEILMCQKWIILDDECAGKSKRDVIHLKNLTSADIFSLREPYGRNNVDLKRLAVLCATSNELELLSDSTGNRRIIPIHFRSLNFSQYNSANKIEMWMEAYKLYKSGFDWKVEGEDIAYLGVDSDMFEVAVSEQELITKYFEPNGAYEVTATDIKVYIEKHTNQRLSLDRIGKELKRLGYKQTHKKLYEGERRISRRIYMVNYTLGAGVGSMPVAPGNDRWTPPGASWFDQGNHNDHDDNHGDWTLPNNQ